MHPVEIGEGQQPALDTRCGKRSHRLTGSAVRGQWLPSGAVADEIQRPEHSQAAHLPNHRVRLGQCAQPWPEHGFADLRGVLHDAVLVHSGDRGQRRGTRQRVAGVGQSTRKDSVVERCCDLIGDDHAAQRHVSGVRALGKNDQVGIDAPVVEGEPRAGAAEPGHHLIGDVDDAVLVAQRSYTIEIPGWRYEHSCGADDRFDHDRGHCAWALKGDDLLEMRQSPLGFLFRGLGPKRRPVQVRAEEVHVSVGKLVGPAPRVAGGGDRGTGVPVVAAVETEHLVAPSVQPGHPDGIFSRVRTAVGEEHFVVSRGRQIGDGLRGSAAHQGRMLRGERHLHARLLLNRRDDRRVLMADIGVDQLAGEIQEFGAVEIPHLAASAGRQHPRIQRPLRTPGMENMRPVEGECFVVGAVQPPLGKRLLIGHALQRRWIMELLRNQGRMASRNPPLVRPLALPACECL